MNDLQKIGGVSALIEAATYMIGFGLLFALLVPAGYSFGDGDPGQALAFLADNQPLLYLWNLIIYVVNGVFLVVLVLALHQRLKADTPAVMQVASAFGLIWAAMVTISGLLILGNLGVVADLYRQNEAQAVTVWLALSAVEEGLGGEVELLGGLWVLLVSWAALRVGGLPRALNYLGVIIGISGIVTLVPLLGEARTVFGLGFIVWFAWVGIVLLRTAPSASVA